MIGSVADRREAKVASIVAVAWELARSHGIGGVTLHALAREVGMRQPSLYAYFDSKLALFDAMFADGNRQLLAHVDALRLPSDPRNALKVYMRAFVDFATEDPARQALLFQRIIPGFEPSEESYAAAQQFMARSVSVMNAAGVVDQDDIDCLIAMVGGLVDAQQSNDPGGHRWTRHLDRLIDMYLDDIKRRRRRR
ncbi:MAG: transcriptional regulator, TetR family [Acidimicrobiales bacterium]|jgi:AcrR family transcriptional regulator|nr:transcriptional regulator, TetR family [Acidimicrobiales bacterium]